MKVSEFLKKVGTIERAEIWIEFKANRKDTDPDLERLTENTPEEKADQIAAHKVSAVLLPISERNGLRKQDDINGRSLG